jgi:hypothetical protein
VKVSGNGEAQNFYLLRLDQPQPQSGGSSQDDQQEQDKDDQDQDKQDEQDKQDQANKPDPAKQDPPASPKPQQAKPLEDLLDKLDHNPDNLEARKAAKDNPRSNHPPDKDW